MEEMPSIEEITEGLEQFLKELAYSLYARLLGTSSPGDELAIYDKYERIISPQTAQYIKNEADEGPLSDPRKRAQALRIIIEHLLNRALHPHREAYSESLKGERIPWGKGFLPFQGSENRMANEWRREVRDAIEAVRIEIIKKNHPLLARCIFEAHHLAEEQGFAGYVDMWEELHGFSFSSLLELLRPLMDETEDMYRDIFQWWCRKKVKTKVREVKRHDLLYMFRAHDYDPLFGGTSVAAACYTTAREMGLDPMGLSNISIEESGKRGRARCIPAQIPGEIILILPRGEEWAAHARAMHALGEALCYSHVDPGGGFHNRVLGDPSIPLSFALLMENLIGNPLWLERNLRQAQLGDFIRLVHLIRLFLIRRSYARLEYSLSLNDGSPLKGKERTYRELMVNYTGVDYPEAYYLNDWDPTFQSGIYLRACILEAIWSDHMVRSLGREWFRLREAGDLLTDIWRDGRKFGPADLLKSKGLGEMDVKSLTRGICRILAG